MKKVNLELSSEQYKELIKLVYIGDWVIDEPENIVLHDLVQEIFSKAKDGGHESLIEFDKELNLHMPSQAFDDEVVEIVDDYEEKNKEDDNNEKKNKIDGLNYINDFVPKISLINNNHNTFEYEEEYKIIDN